MKDTKSEHMHFMYQITKESDGETHIKGTWMLLVKTASKSHEDGICKHQLLSIALGCFCTCLGLWEGSKCIENVHPNLTQLKLKWMFCSEIKNIPSCVKSPFDTVHLWKNK